MKIIFIILIIIFQFNHHFYAQNKKIFLWWDCHANYQIITQKDSIDYYLTKCKEIGITDVVLDVKPITGKLIYPSKIAPQMLQWKSTVFNNSFDIVDYFIEKSHSLNLKVHASFNIFVGGHMSFNDGIVFEDKQEWQTQLYHENNIKKITAINNKISAMINPCNDKVQQYQLNILKEFVEKYKNVDGIILDRTRYDGLNADFSEDSKQKFLAYGKIKNINFPDDVLSKSQSKKTADGKYHKKWLEWRASVIYDFFVKAKKQVKKIKPEISFGNYTGSWYPTYYEVGVNWASNKFKVHKKFDWATKKYKNYGIAQLLDLYMSGCYYYEVENSELQNTAIGSKNKDIWNTVQGSAEMAMKITQKDVPVIASLYVVQYYKNENQFKKAMKMCLNKTNGLMIFDMVHIIEKDWWLLIKEAIQ